MPGELVVDNFAGGGGASTGIEAAIGRPVDLAVNHDPVAIAMHQANHPETKHFCESIWEVDPREACGGKPVGLAWFSPDCTHFSKAKGTVPLKKEIRGLAWVVIRWAKAVRPRVIVIENVEEFQTWGPLGDDDRPLPDRAGETFREWLAELSGLGYRVEYRLLVAADYGTPTTRKRLFLVARCDGGAIVWPEASHGAGKGQGWRPASEVIDWSLPCPSIFDRKKPLAEATLQRIGMGIRRYVIDAAQPFIVGAGGPSYSGKPAPTDRPLGAVLAENHRALVSPFLVRHGHYSTITGAGLRSGCGAGTFRGQQLKQPLATVCATNDKHLVMPLITKFYKGVVGHEVTRPLGTVTAWDHHALTAAFLSKHYGTSKSGAGVDRPMPTVTAGGNHLAEVRAFLIKYYGAQTAQQQGLFDPLHTVTAKARFGLVMVHGEPYQIVDIGMRMLQPHELFAAQGFPDWYDIRPEHNGKPMTKEAQTSLAGNSVCPPVAEAIVAANAMASAVAA
jgi:DNA (cytosine-5)-methyltransferase 1